MMNIRTFITLCAAFVLPATARAADFPPPLTVPLGLGVHAYYPELPPSKELTMMQEAGFTWVRILVAWKQIETQKGVYDFSFYEQLFSAMEAAHLQPYVVLGGKNPLYKGSPVSPAGGRGYATFAGAMAKHFAGKRIVWEIMNEPNTKAFWHGNILDAAEYGKVAAAASRAIREADPHAVIVGPAINGGVEGPLYLDTVLAQGAGKDWSAVSIHPYRDIPEEIITGEPSSDPRAKNLYSAYRQIMEKHGVNIPLIAGEVGWSTDETTPRTPQNRYASLEDEAKFIGREYLTNLMSGIPITIWFNWKDNNQRYTGEKEWKFYHGVASDALAPKPAYTAIQTLTRMLGGFTFSERFKASSADFVLSFRKGGETRIAAWTTAATHNISIPVPVGCYQITDYMGVRETTLRQTNAQKTLTLPVSDGIRYLVKTACGNSPH